MSGGAANKLDRIPPQSIDAERAVLGAMLLNPDAVRSAIEVLDDSTEMFYVAAHQLIYETSVAMFRCGTPVDPVTLTEQLSNEGLLDTVGGASYIADLTGSVPTSANIKHYATLVRNTWAARTLITSANSLATDLYEQPMAWQDKLEQHAARLKWALRKSTKFVPDALLDLDNLPPIKWLFHELIPIGQVSVLCSPGNLGKSRLAIGLIATVVLGRPLWRDFHPLQQGRVLYLSAEDGLVTVLHRLKSYRDVFGLDKNAFAQAMVQSLTLHCESGHNFCEFNPVSKTVNQTPYYNEVLGWCEKKKPAMIVVDTLSDHAGGINENDNGQAKIFMKLLKQIAVVSDGALLLIHHTGKGAETEESSNALRGASAIANSARAVFLCKQEGCAAEIRVHLTKSNLSRRTGEAWAFDGSRYAFTELGVSSPPLCQRNVDLVVDTLVKWVNDNPGKATAAQLARTARGDPEVRTHCVMAHNWATGDVLARAFKIAVNQGYIRLAVGPDKKTQCLHPGDTAVPVKQASVSVPETTETDDDSDDDDDSGMLF